MFSSDFYEETKWCAHCKQYVHYLRALDHTYCVECNREVTRVRRKSDWARLVSAGSAPASATEPSDRRPGSAA